MKNILKLTKKVKNKFETAAQKTAITLSNPTDKQAQIALFAFGVTILTTGLTLGADAQGLGGGGGTLSGTGSLQTEYNDARLADAVNAILTYVEGTFGAMVMVAAGVGAILSSAFGQYRAALGLLVVAVGAFILRSLIGTFFNDTNIQA